MLAEAQLVASAINPQHVRNLSGSQADLDSADYQRLKQQLQTIREANPQYRFVYLMGRRPDGSVFFFVDSEPPQSPDYSPPGSPYPEVPPGDLKAFETREPQVHGPDTDRWGTWVSASIPLVDQDSGELVAVLGVDIDAHDWVRTVVWRAAFPGGILLGLSLILSLWLLIAIAAAGRQERNSGFRAAGRWESFGSAACLLRPRTSHLLVGMCLLGVAFLVVVTSQIVTWARAQIERSAEQEARLLATFNAALRDYVAAHIRPEMEKRVAPHEFIPEAMSSAFIARQVFEKVRERFPRAMVRFPSRNPRNPANRPTPAEEDILRFFEENPEVGWWSGKVKYSDKGEEYLVYASARHFKAECLSCHGDPADAPAGLIEYYGQEGGFGHREGDVALDLVAIPLTGTYAQARQQLMQHLVAATVLCLLYVGMTVGLVWLDAAGHRAVESALHESREHLAATLRSIGDGVITCDREGKITGLNRVAEALTGWKAKEAVGRPVQEVFHIIDARTGAIAFNPVARTLAEGVVVELENHTLLIARDGSRRHIADSCAPIRNLEGEILGAVLVFRDVTEAYQQREALRESEALLRSITDSAQDAIIMIDSQGLVTFWNPAAEAIFGYSAEEVLGRDLHMLVMPERFALACPAGLRTFAQTGTGTVIGQRLELVARRKDGGEIPVELSVSAVHIKGQWHAVGILRDISQRKEAERKLEEQKNLLQTILDGIPDVVALKTVDRDVVAFNKAGYEFVGLSPELAHGNRCYRLMGREDPCEGCVCEEAVLTGQAITREIFFPETGRWVRATGIPIRDESGRVTAVVEQVQEITEKKRTELELQAMVQALAAANRTLEELNQAAEAATRAKSEFLANMSHEIRTPMTAILGYAELLLQEPGIENAPPDRRLALQTIYRNGEYLLRLLDDVLDLAKIEAGKLRVEQKECHLPSLLADLRSLMQVRAKSKGLSLDIENDGPIPETIYTDPVRLRQILINLVGNAIKFTEVGGVRVVVRLLREQDDRRKLAFDVIDTGIGIPPDKLEKIFEPFEQADTSVTRRFGGTGLGLTISRRLAQMLGGDITVESTLGKGSTFRLTIDPGSLDGIPMVTESPVANGTYTAAQPTGSGAEIRLAARILLAEDGPDNQRFFDFILRKAGAEVTLVENGKDAVEAALAARDRGEPFDLILMDMQMPIMDGYQATRQLRAAGYEGLVIALTAHALEGAAEECREAGCDDYISKPVDRLFFLQKLATLLESRPSPAPAGSGSGLQG
jgi:two-component system CheB/CheR fusion protein